MKNRYIKLCVFILSITGALLLDFSTPAPGLGEAFRTGTVTTNVNLRKTPGLQGDILTGLLQGARVEIYAEKGGWLRVTSKKYHLLFDGWVSKQYVDVVPVDTVATPSVTEVPESIPIPQRIKPPPALPEKPTLPEVKPQSVSLAPRPDEQAAEKVPHRNVPPPKPVRRQRLHRPRRRLLTKNQQAI